jgi:DUF4097 and DUF4098 domain-containing protein YvlB
MKVAAAVFVVLVVAVCTSSPESVAGDGRSVSKVNGSVRAEAGEVYDSVSTVNGKVTVGAGSTVDEAETVNGQIVVENDAKVGTLETVNGSLEIGEGVTVAREASTVNGGVRLANRARVGGDISTVSGEIELRGAEVGGSLRTTNGDIDLKDGARVRGGIHVKEKNGGWNWGKDKPIKVYICSTCVVEGELRFERPVELRVEQGAKIGKVTGDEVKRL